LFPQPAAQILELVLELSRFEQALMSDERGDSKAAELYEKAIEEGDCVADAHCNLGIIESQRGNTTKAFDCFTSSLKHDPRHSEAHYNLGNLYFDANDFRLAQMHYEMAVEVDPSFRMSILIWRSFRRSITILQPPWSRSPSTSNWSRS
jgi:tetratricopeptide (TPR) repeat protein